MGITKMPKTRREREVWEACDELWEELQEEGLPVSKLTGEKLKDRLVRIGYSRGDQGQIYRYRNSWRLSRGIEENEDLVNEERNATLSEKVLKSVELLFKEIQTEADEKITRSKNESETQVKEFSNKYDAVNREAEVLRGKLNEIIEELNAIKQTNSELSLKLNEEKHQHDITKEKLTGLEVNYNQLKLSSTKCEQALNERNEKDKYEFQIKMQELVDAHKKDMSTMREYSENQRHQYIIEIENVKVSNNQLDKQLEKSTLLEQKANSTNIELKQRIRSLEGELEHSHKIRDDSIQKAHNAEKDVAETKGELKQLQILLSNQKEDQQNINKQLLEYKERVGRLEEQLQRAEADLVKNKVAKDKEY